MARPILRLGLIGHGTVGNAFLKAVRQSDDLVQSRLDVRLEVAQVAVRAPDRHQRILPGVRVHDDPSALVDDPTLDLIVEASGAPQAAQWIARGLQRGVPVVTANKLALARDPSLLLQLAERHPLLHCEAAVAAALPIVRALRDSFEGEEIYEARAVLNATTTYILDRIATGDTFPQALELARGSGYAEADAAADLSGLDAAAKLALLATIIWRRPLGLDRVRYRGIDGGIAERVLAARRRYAVIRLVATARETDEALHLTVEPTVLDGDDPLARTEGVTSAVLLHGTLAGPLTWYGAGAGGMHTASALLNDVLTAARTLRRQSVCGRIAA
jgi:homoserine dehydrogenase